MSLKILSVVTITTATGVVVSANLGNSEFLSLGVSSTPSTVVLSGPQSSVESVESGESGKKYSANIGYRMSGPNDGKCNIYVISGHDNSNDSLIFTSYNHYSDWSLAERNITGTLLKGEEDLSCDSKKNFFVYYAYSNLWTVSVGKEGPGEIL